MTAPFAALEARMNRTVIDHLANAEAVINGQTVSGLFKRDYAEAISGLVSGANLIFACAAEDVPGVKQGDAVTMGAENFTVAQAEPDGTGWMTLILLKAS